jgi:glutathionylspermidine synthase
MQRIPVDERSDWRELVEQSGFVFHSVNGERYWDESAYYAFGLKEIEDDLEAPLQRWTPCATSWWAVRSQTT